MATVKGIASIQEDSYKNVYCPFCGYFLKIAVSPTLGRSNIDIKCARCKTAVKFRCEEVENGSEKFFELNMSVNTAIATTIELRAVK